MTRDRLTWTVLVVLVWTAMMSFGGVAAETVMLYPNIFGDPPASLDRAREFLVAGGPSDYFPPLGATVVLACLAAAVLTWRDRRLRWWIAGAAVVFVACEFLFSVFFFWPRNEIMFVDPVGTHSPEYLRQVAAEFVAGHRVRLVGGAVTAALAFVALLRWAGRPGTGPTGQAARRVTDPADQVA
ncbi:anthrone oxygenase family protein [Micromonospora sp. NPDC048868]|uniref:anthrone oxygenase family protein n=1 Tax=Micromonospora sp. NPDC048868 TaxID=3364258 RepID=UPI0037223EE5